MNTPRDTNTPSVDSQLDPEVVDAAHVDPEEYAPIVETPEAYVPRPDADEQVMEVPIDVEEYD